MPPSVALIGQSERAEFAPVRAALAAEGLPVTNSDGDLQCISAPPFADLCVVCQSWPDEYSSGDVRRIVTACAASRLVCAYGAWCASDGRSRAIWPGAARVPVNAFPLRLQFELDVIAGRAVPLPVTAARDECFAARVQPL